MKKALLLTALCICFIFSASAHAGLVTSWSYSPYGWSTSTTITTANASWFYRPVWTTWAYTPTYFYTVTPRYYTILYPSYSPAQQQRDFNQSLRIIEAKEWAYDTKKKMMEQKQAADQKQLEDIQIDIDMTPTEESPAIQPVETKSTDQQDMPQPKEVQILAMGTVVMKTY